MKPNKEELEQVLKALRARAVKTQSDANYYQQ